MIELKDINVEYLKDIILQQEDKIELLDDHIRHIIYGKTCVYNNINAGVAYITEFDDHYYFEAYKDINVRLQIKYSLKFGELFLNDFVNRYNAQNIYSVHKISNIMATIALHKLGFKTIIEKGNYIYFVREYGN